MTWQPNLEKAPRACWTDPKDNIGRASLGDQAKKIFGILAFPAFKAMRVLITRGLLEKNVSTSSPSWKFSEKLAITRQIELEAGNSAPGMIETQLPDPYDFTVLGISRFLQFVYLAPFPNSRFRHS